jgi:hypothetical protein
MRRRTFNPWHRLFIHALRRNKKRVSSQAASLANAHPLVVLQTWLLSFTYDGNGSFLGDAVNLRLHLFLKRRYLRRIAIRFPKESASDQAAWRQPNIIRKSSESHERFAPGSKPIEERLVRLYPFYQRFLRLSKRTQRKI